MIRRLTITTTLILLLTTAAHANTCWISELRATLAPAAASPTPILPVTTTLAFDTCDDCAAASYVVYNECLNAHPGQECACSSTMISYCFSNCAPCSFCARSLKQYNTYCL